MTNTEKKKYDSLQAVLTHLPSGWAHDWLHGHYWGITNGKDTILYRPGRARPYAVLWDAHSDRSVKIRSRSFSKIKSLVDFVS